MSPSSSPAPMKSRWPGRLPNGGSAIGFGFHLARFIASTMLMSWGVIAFALLLLGNGSLDGLMHQLHNLARRYVEAEPQRVQSFRDAFAGLHLGVSLLLIVLRRDRIVPALSERKSDRG